MANGNDDDAVLPPHSASTIAATTSTGCHTLRIDGYSATKLATSARDAIDSCRFRAAGHTWRIRCDPNFAGRFFSLSLLLADEDDADGKAAAADVLAKFRFSLVPQGRRRHKAAAPAPGTSTPPPWAAGKYKTDAFPVGRAFSSSLGLNLYVSELEKAPEYLHGDSIIVRCEIAVMDKLVVNGDDCPGKLAPVCSCGGAADADDGEDEDDGLCKHRHVENIKGALWLKEALAKFFFGCLPLWNN